MATVPKTIPVAYIPRPDGSEDRRQIRREKWGWTWQPNAWSSHLDMVVWEVEKLGGRVVREPNPAYRPNYARDVLRQLLGSR